jgi:hypothetical protein
MREKCGKGSVAPSFSPDSGTPASGSTRSESIGASVASCASRT